MTAYPAKTPDDGLNWARRHLRAVEAGEEVTSLQHREACAAMKLPKPKHTSASERVIDRIQRMTRRGQ